MILNAFIVDDESLVRETLKNMIETFCPDVQVIGAAPDIATALPRLAHDDIDILFLDVDLGSNTTGFDLLDLLKGYSFDVVLVTASDQHAVRSYEYDDIVQYLLKPVNHLKLISTVVKIQANLRKSRAYGTENTSVVSSKAGNSYITLPDMNRIVIVPHNNIMYISSNGSYAAFYLADGTINHQSHHLKYFEDILEGNSDFLRIHRSYIVNRKYIKAYIKDGMKIQLLNNMELPTTLTMKELVSRIQM